MITNSEINSLRTLHATFPALLHARLTGYITSDDKVNGKLTNYQSGLASFKMANKFQNNRSFTARLLPFLKMK